MSNTFSGWEDDVCPPPTEQCEIIAQLLAESSTNGIKCAIEGSWWRQWVEYSGYESINGGLSGSPPGPIDNSALHAPGYNGSAGAFQMKTVPVGVFELLERWYGGGPRVFETDLTNGKRSPVEAIKAAVYSTSPPERRFQEPTVAGSLRFYVVGSKTKPWNRDFFEGETVKDALKGGCAHFGLRMSEQVLYCPSQKVEWALDDQLESVTLGEETSVCILPRADAVDEDRIGRTGFSNQGNTCYMNSALQVLMHTPELMEYFLTDKYKEHISLRNPEGSKGRVAEAFADLIKRVWRKTNPGGTVRPYDFWEAFSSEYIQFSAKIQHDTAEFAESVLDALMEDCNRSVIPKTFKIMEDDAAKSDAEMADDNWKYHTSRSDSHISDKFHGQYRAVTTCPSCSFSSRKFESFTVLQLGVPTPKMCELALTLIDVKGNSPPQHLAVDVRGEGTVMDVYVAVAEKIGEECENLCSVLALGQKSAEGEVSMKPADEKISNILGFDAVVVYHYPEGKLGPESGGKETHFIHQKQTLYTTSFPWPGTQIREKQKFGFPLVVWIPEVSRSDNVSSCSRSPRKRSLEILEEIFEVSLRPAKRKKEELAPVILLPAPPGVEETGGVEEVGNSAPSSIIRGLEDGDNVSEVAQSISASIAEEPAPSPATRSPTGNDGEVFDWEAEYEQNLAKNAAYGNEGGDFPSAPVLHAEETPAMSENYASDECEGPMSDKGSQELAKEQYGANGDWNSGGGVSLSQDDNVGTQENYRAISQVVSDGQEEEQECNTAQEGDGQSLNGLPNPENGGGGNTTEIEDDDADSMNAQGGGDISEGEYDPLLTSLLDEPTYGPTYGPYLNDVPCHQETPTRVIGTSDDASYDLMEIDDDEDGQAAPQSSSEKRSRKIIVDWSNAGEDKYDLEMVRNAVNGHASSRNDEVHTILECFEHDFSAHPLDKNNLWKCGRCNEHVEGVKSMRLWKAPDVLLISLKRFNFNGHKTIKLNSHIHFPLIGLDISEFCGAPGEGRGNDELLYDLTGVCYHHGDDPRSGHYTSVARMHDGRWCKFNDGEVSAASVGDDLISRDAYLLCYRRRGAACASAKETLLKLRKAEEMERKRSIDENYAKEKLTESEEDFDVYSNKYQETGTTYTGGKFSEWNSFADYNGPYNYNALEGVDSLEYGDMRTQWDDNEEDKIILSQSNNENNELVVNGKRKEEGGW
ncbi:hypothetical protein BSKO_06406 [Bryopsis sp. KO-2023]|nr:hypothetical protein BSKO_06406 [Bryopsis sp. KO-2023]